MQDIYNELSSLIEKQKIKYNKDTLKQVCEYICLEYENKKRYSNITLLEHCVGVAKEVISMRLDENSIYAALLHEMIKLDESYDKSKIKNICGNEVVDMIETISKLSCLNYGSDENKNKEALRKMFLSVGKDIRTVVIKLIDRLYNMRNLKELSEIKYQENMAKESLYIYAPIAHRLGMSQVKSELEDLSFRVLYKEEYLKIKKEIDEKKKVREEYIKNRIDEINNALKKQKINATIYGRPKHFYSIYKKMQAKGCKAEDLFDLLAIRIIVDSIKDCYSALGIVHDMYKPLPGRFKDYIAVPKTNMYQSLHTTVFGEGARPFEIQIRTWDMHKVADYGIAAHFAYKEKKQRVDTDDEKLISLRKMLEIQKEVINDTNSMFNIKEELFGEEVFVYTPKGDIISLPKGSSIIDFAYMIHQKVAESMIGAKVNSKMVPLSTKLQNTDIVEIVTSKTSKGPSSDWLTYVKTTGAKNKIVSFIKRQNKDENIIKGKEIFEKELRNKKVHKDILQNTKKLDEVLKSFSFKTIDELYENIGFGSVNPKKVINKLKEDNKDVKNDKKINLENKSVRHVEESSIVNIKNIDNCLVKFSKCCSPIPGDDIIGYITYSNGVSIHRKDCKNLLSFSTVNRLIDASWKSKISAKFDAKLIVRANTSENLLSDIILKLKELKVVVKDISSKNNIDRETIVSLVITIPDNEFLQNVIKNLRKVDCVYDVKRDK